MPLPPLAPFLSKAWPTLNTLLKRRAALDVYIEGFNQAAVSLASQLRSGGMGVDAWQMAMRAELKQLHVNALVLSYGGDRSAISFAEWGRLGGHMKVQYRYLRNYAQQIQNNAMGVLMQQNKLYSEKYLAWRSKLYGGNSRASFYRGMAMGLLEQVPGDGKTSCLTSCKCELRFELSEDTPGLMLVFWELRPAEHCEDCEALSETWNPLELYLPASLAADWVDWLPRMRITT